MRHLIAPVALLALLSGCHGTQSTTNDLANSADRMADSVDNWGDTASNSVDAQGNTTQGRIAGLDNRMAGLVDPPAAEGWIGRWKGVEGLTLTIAADPAKRPGHYQLTDRYTLDDKGVFDGVAKGNTIVFTRPDGQQVLRETEGKDTGLKYLAEKIDCLTVKAGEGYCRD
jgi:hypothetical protein